MWAHATQLRGFSALLHDLDQIRDGRLASLHRRREAATEAAEMAQDIREGGRLTVKAVDSLTAEMGEMAKSIAVMNQHLAIQQRADAREKLAQINERILESISRGELSGTDGAVLDGMLHRVARSLEHD